MKLSNFFNLFDDWNRFVVINNNNLKPIAKGKIYAVVISMRKDLENLEVVSFGFYDNELTVRVKENKKETSLDDFLEKGFKYPADYIINEYGIRIYIGNEENDWCINIPSKLLAIKIRNTKSMEIFEPHLELYLKKYKNGLNFYGVSKEFCLSKAEEWTNIAKKGE